MKLLPAIFSVPVLFSLISSPALAENNSVGEPLVTWSKRSVRVCWQKPKKDSRAFSPSERVSVQQIIQKEYTLKRTGIEFVGWNDCDLMFDAPSDVHILQDSDVSKDEDIENARTIEEKVAAEYVDHILGQADIGEGGTTSSKVANRHWLFFTYQERVSGFYSKQEGLKTVYLTAIREKNNNPWAKISNLQKLQITALHEFGHLAGLRHEHAREESHYDLNCYSMVKRGELTEELMETATPYAEYDPNSIMNYCWIRFMTKHGLEFTFKPQELIRPSVEVKLFEEQWMRVVFEEPKFGVLKMLPNVTDSSLYSYQKNQQTQVVNLKFKIALSAKDIKTLRALYP